MLKQFRFFYILIIITALSCSGNGDSEGPEFSFGVLADVQYCDCDPESGRYFRDVLSKFEACVEEFNSKELAFVIQLGDIIDKDFDSFDTVLPIFDKLKMPKYHVLGNHEFSVAQEMKESVLQKLGLQNGYYDISGKRWRFIILDGNDVSSYKVPKDTEAYANAKERLKKLQAQGLENAQKYNGALGEKQISWLKRTLEKASQAGEKVILFCHHPVFPKTIHALWNDTEVMKLIESYDCVVAYMNGHNHAGNYEQKNGVHYLTLRGMVDTPDKSAYAMIEVYKDRLEVIGYGREPSRTLHFGNL